MNRIAALLLLLVAIVSGIVFWLSGNFDNLVEVSIRYYGSAMTRARVSAGAVKIAPASGKGAIGKLMIGNPAGFRSGYALKADQVDVLVDVASVTDDVVFVRLIVIDRPDVIYEKGESMTNFEALQKNIAAYTAGTRGWKDQEIGKLIVEELTICNARAHAIASFIGDKPVSIALPDITLRNIGKARGGISPGELGQEIIAALNAKLTVAGSFDRLKKSTGETMETKYIAVKGLPR